MAQDYIERSFWNKFDTSPLIPLPVQGGEEIPKPN